MPCIAIVPVPNSVFGEDSEVIKEYTKLTPTRVFGREMIVDWNSKTLTPPVNAQAVGISAYFECSEEEFDAEHPGAWFSINPVAGRWYQLSK